MTDHHSSADTELPDDPFGTLHRALWVGGGQWAGKSTVARLLAVQYGVTFYHYDHQDARGHNDRRIARRVARGEPATEPDPDKVWVHTTPEEMATTTLAGFPERFQWALDDLRALVSGRPVIAEGWGLRPELVAPIVDSPRRMIVMVPTPEFRDRQVHELPRAAAPTHRVSDPVRAQANRLARDRLVAEDAVRSAHQLGIRVIAVDGSRDAAAIAEIVADHFSPYLPEPGKGFE
jgi:2-phosphoglycerate kinase